MSSAAEVLEAIALLRAAGTDTQGVEAKSAAGGLPKSVRHSLSAFANTAGGLVLLGVDEEDDFRVVDVDASRLASHLSDVCRDQIEPPVSAHIEIVDVEGQPIVAGWIDELPADRKPAYVKTKGMNNGAFTRVHDGDRRLTTHEVAMLLANRTQPRYDSEPVPGTSVEDFDADIVRGFVERLRGNKPSTFGDVTLEEALLLVGALERGPEGAAIATLGGLMSFGRYPQRWFPQLNLVVVAYPTPDHTPLADGTRFLDNVSIDGPIPKMVVDGVAAVQRNLSRRTRVPSLLREDEWDYPLEVIRELVVNALMHRDLSPAARGTQVRLEIYPDRLVVENPGGLFGPVSPADLGTRTVSSSRNALLGKLLEDTPLPSGGFVAENRGSGFVTLTRRLEAIGMSRPHVRAGVADFTVALGSASLLDDVALDALDGLDTSDWTDLDRLIVAVAHREDEVTNERMREVSGKHAADVGASFLRLSTWGVLERVGSGRGSRWRLVTPAPTESSPPTGTDKHPTVPLSGHDLLDAPQAQALLDLLTEGAASTRQLEEVAAIGGRRNVLIWLGRLEEHGLVQPTEARRKSPANKWRLTAAGRARKTE